jgi:hypothetical protein
MLIWPDWAQSTQSAKQQNTCPGRHFQRWSLGLGALSLYTDPGAVKGLPLPSEFKFPVA